MRKSVEGFTDFIIDIPVTWRKLVHEEVKNGKIDLVCAVRIGGMHFRLDVGGIVEQNVENIVTFMLIGANDFGIDGDMVSYQGVGDNAFFQPEVFGRMTGIDSMDSGFKLLSVAAGMDGLVDIVMPEYGERSDEIADTVVCLRKGFGADKII